MLGGSSGLLGCGSLPGLQFQSGDKFVESRLLRLGFLAGLTCLTCLSLLCGGLHGGCGFGLDGHRLWLGLGR